MTDFDQRERVDRLEITLQNIESLQQTGILEVERAKGGVRETGRIVVLYGQAVEATAGKRVGNDALEWLQTWGSCRYTFVPKYPSDIVVSSPVPDPPPPPPTTNSTSPLAFLTQFIQKNLPTTDEEVVPNNQSFAEGAFTRRTDDLYMAPATPVPEANVPSYMYQPAPHTPKVPELPAEPVRAPYRLINGDGALAYMDRAKLSRLHRHVFFLLDGQRTPSDIVRITGRPLFEIQHLLTDLEQVGLVRIGGAFF